MPIPARRISSVRLLDKACIRDHALINVEIVGGGIRDIFVVHLIDLLELLAADPLIEFSADVEARLADFKGSLAGGHRHIVTRGHN